MGEGHPAKGIKLTTTLGDHTFVDPNLREPKEYPCRRLPAPSRGRTDLTASAPGAVVHTPPSMVSLLFCPSFSTLTGSEQFTFWLWASARPGPLCIHQRVRIPTTNNLTLIPYPDTTTRRCNVVFAIEPKVQNSELPRAQAAVILVQLQA